MRNTLLLSAAAALLAAPGASAAQARRAPAVPSVATIPLAPLAAIPGTLTPLAAPALSALRGPSAAVPSAPASPVMPAPLAASPSALNQALNAVAPGSGSAAGTPASGAEAAQRLEQLYEGRGKKLGYAGLAPLWPSHPTLGGFKDWRLEGFHRVLDRLQKSGGLTKHDRAVLRRSAEALRGKDSYAKAYSAVLALDAEPEAVTGLPNGEAVSDEQRLLDLEKEDQTSPLGRIETETRTLSRTARYWAPEGGQQVYYRKWVEDEGDVLGEAMSAEHGNRYHLLFEDRDEFRRLAPLFAKASAYSEGIPRMLHGLLRRRYVRAALVVREDRSQLGRFGRRTVTYLDQKREESYSTGFGGDRTLVAGLWTLSLRRFYHESLGARPVTPRRAFALTWAGETAAEVERFWRERRESAKVAGLLAGGIAAAAALWGAMGAYIRGVGPMVAGPVGAVYFVVGAALVLLLSWHLATRLIAVPAAWIFELLSRWVVAPVLTVAVGIPYAAAAGLVRARREAAAVKGEGGAGIYGSSFRSE